MKFIEEDIALVNKPYGMTSFGVIKLMRKRLENKKIGHAGTLDPLASGLMILGIGLGTKKIMNYMKLDKEYVFTIVLGLSTNTDDLEGNIVNQSKNKVFNKVDIESVLEKLKGEIELPVPAFSSIKLNGERLYKIARKDRSFSDTPKKIMNIKSISLIDLFTINNFQMAKLKCYVSSGTYIRSISKEVGNKLGVPTTISELIRTRVDKYELNAEEIADDISWFQANLGGTKVIKPNQKTFDTIFHETKLS